MHHVSSWQKSDKSENLKSKFTHAIRKPRCDVQNACMFHEREDGDPMEGTPRAKGIQEEQHAWESRTHPKPSSCVTMEIDFNR